MRLAALAIGCLVPLVAFAVDEPFCVVPENCVDDLIGLGFPATGGAAELTGVSPGEEFTLEVFLDVKSEHLQGFSYGVKHDTSLIEILSATDEEADPLIVESRGITRLYEVEPGHPLAFIQQVAIRAGDVSELPVRDGYRLAKARYRVMAPVPPAGTKLIFSNNTACPACPKVATNFTISGKSKTPRIVRNAIARNVTSGCLLPGFGFYFGPQPDSAPFDLAGADRLPIMLRNMSPVLGFSLGIKQNGDALTFDSSLGLPPVELAITRSDGSEVSGDLLKGNSAKGAPRLGIGDVAKGAALAGPSGDFFGKRILPAGIEGGPGVTVGYVVDASGNGRVIPAVADNGPACGGQEILVVTFGGGDLGFSRGDANGDGKINVTDGVLVAQNIFARQLIVFDCADMLDVNDDGQLNTADPVFLLSYVFLKGPQPAPPFRVCAFGDPTQDTLFCPQPNCR